MENRLSAPNVLSGALPKRHVLSGETMGTRYSAMFYSEAEPDRLSLFAQMQNAVDRVDDQMSPWKPDSVVSRFNRADPGTWIDLPEETFEVVHAALVTNLESDGVFDPFVGELVSAWGFGPEQGEPDAEETSQLRRSWMSRPRQVELDREGRRLRRQSDSRLDLCGIAKGYGVDRLSQVLGTFGYGDHLVSIDGEVRVSGRKPEGGFWHVAVEQPDHAVRSSAFSLEVADTAIATSGTYRQVRRLEGLAASHTMDPQTGWPVQNGLVSVSVLAADCMTADAWATAFMVMGAQKALARAREIGLDAIFMVRDELGQIKTLATDPQLVPA